MLEVKPFKIAISDEAVADLKTRLGHARWSHAITNDWSRGQPASLIMELTDKAVRENGLTALMVTDNLRYAIQYGDRLLMLHQGGIVLDKAGKEKEATRLEDVLDLFTQISIELGN